LQRYVCQKAHYGTTYQRGVATCPLVEPCYSRRIAQGKKILAPPAGSRPLLRWAQGPLSVPCRPGTPAYKIQTTVRSRACNNALSRVPQHWAQPPCVGGLWCCHASYGSGPRLPTREGFETTMHPAALDPASLRGRALRPPRVSRHRTPPPRSEGSETATRLVVPDSASQRRRAPGLRRVPLPMGNE
jgi:hypothetical protein